MKTKKPWLAALLTVIFSGLGHLYVGKRKLFATLIITGEITAYIWIFSEPEVAKQMESNVWAVIAGLLWIIALAIDAYEEAKTI